MPDSPSEPIPSLSQAQREYDEALDHMASGALDDAIRAFETCLALDPHFHDALHGLIRALMDRGSLDAAIAYAHRLITIDPDDVLPHTSLSILYQRKGMIPEAEAEALRAKLLGWKEQLNQRPRAGGGTS